MKILVYAICPGAEGYWSLGKYGNELAPTFKAKSYAKAMVDDGWAATIEEVTYGYAKVDPRIADNLKCKHIKKLIESYGLEEFIKRFT